ncbi:MAG: hypothetical protein AAF633_17490, partial [Chloroflexota bacterium]
MQRWIGKPGIQPSYLRYLPASQQLSFTSPAPFAAPPAWIFDPLGPASARFFRIHPQSQPDHSLHVQTEEIACEPVPPGWNSAYWWLDPLDTHDTFIIRNFWRQGYVLFQDGDQLKAGPLAGREDDPALHWLIKPISRSHLLVPIHLDALWLPEAQAVVDKMADFSHLPHFDGERDINPNTPNLSQSILNAPLDPPQLYLKSGLHLHWALPDALHSGQQQAHGLHLPRVPDRWLITKRKGESSQSWVVESNYLHPPGSSTGSDAITYPFSDGIHPHPYRHLGRQLPLAAWHEQDRDGQHPDYLHTLTALGYGEPNFAPFYPNCYSVFGFFDEESEGQSLDELKNVTYDVIGWHSTHDILQDKRLSAAIDDLIATRPDINKREIIPFKFAALENEYGWTLNRDQPAPYPIGTSYFARLTIASNATDASPTPSAEPKIVLGNTATEALASHLGLEIGKNEREARQLEEQLEALMLLPEVEGETFEASAKFRELRHAQGFKGIHGGTITTIVPESHAHSPADAPHTPHHLEVDLPFSLAKKLDGLNKLERAAFEGLAEQQGLREQLFSDWYKYMLAAYPPADSHDDYPAMDEIAYFIEQYTLPELVGHSAWLGEASDLSGIWWGIQVAKIDLELALQQLQTLYPEDILDWTRFIKRFVGEATLIEPSFRPLLYWLTNSLAPHVQALLRPDRRRQPYSDGDKAVLLGNINNLFLSIPRAELREEMLAQLSAEAKTLVARFQHHEPNERKPLGRLHIEREFPEILIR